MQVAPRPSVNLVVRSVGRAELDEALASAAAQSYPRLTIVVVDATGGRHPPVPQRCGDHEVRFVAGTTPRKRAAAANAGLDAADADYVGFLDDDDLLLPRHVERLVDTLERDADAVLAFGVARETRGDGRMSRVGNGRLTRLVLLEQCFFPPCAALFRRSAAAGCRFDEALDAAEDWDFWLQLSRRGPFRFVDEETALYRADLGRSAMSSHADDVAQHWRDVVWFKWSDDRDALVREVDDAFETALGHAARGDYRASAAAADAVLALQPFHAGALCLRGTHQAMHGRMDAARSDFAAAVDADPEDASALFNLAQANERLGRHHDAAVMYARVLDLAPGHPAALAKLGALRASTPPSRRP